MIQKYIDQVSDLAVSKPHRTVAAFLLVTVVLSAGLSNISTETGTSQFSEGTDAQEALESVNSEFGPTFSTAGSSTQLIKTDQNALSKNALIDMLETEKSLQESGILISSISSPADIIANALDPRASNYQQKISALESATPTQIDSTIKKLQQNPGFKGLVSKDFNAQSGYASGMLGSVSHPFDDSDQLQSAQLRMDRGTDDVTVYGSGIVNSEFSSVIADSLIIVVPAAAILIVFFLIYSYRDPMDLILGIVSLVMAMVWTFGFMGLAGIAFSQMLIAVPPLLLAVGIDFGIHAVNRYKEERASQGIEESMNTALRQLLVAFFMVSGTTVIGFLSNLTSSLGPIQDFGLVAGIGITFTTLIFGLFLPSAKLLSDRKRRDLGIPIFGEEPVGAEDSFLGKVLPLTAKLGKAPYVSVLLLVVLGASVGYYGTGVNTSFSQEDFLPPEDVPNYIEDLPEPFAPSEYSSTQTLNMIEDTFGSQSSVILYIDAPLRDPTVLEEIQRRSENVPDSYVTEDGEAQYSSLIGVIESTSASSPRFRKIVQRNDVDGDGLPDENLGEVYDELFEVAPDSAGQYLSDDYRSTQVNYDVEPSASQAEITEDSNEFASGFRTSAIATGMTIVFKGVSDVIFSSAIKALAISLVLSLAFLILMYELAFEKPFLAVANMFPVALTLSLIVGTMRALGVPLNAMTATILSITIGLGVDYSVHVTHRFEDELSEGKDLFEALKVTLQGTGGALTSSMLTTVTGIGVLVLAITPILGQFGFITSISILYSYLSSLIALPPALVIWYRLRAE